MERPAGTAPSYRAVVAGGLGLTGLFVAGLLLLMTMTTYDVWGALLLGPILVAISLPALSREAARRGDRRLFWLLLLALCLKLAGSVARSYVASDVYGGASDAVGYHRAGIRISDRFTAGNFDPGPNSLPPVGTNFIEIVTGIVYTVIRPTELGGFLFFSWLAFWGLFCLYKAFTLAVPQGRHDTYARLLFFLPSLIFWPSSPGKEAWMVFTLGMAAYGGARLLTGATWRGLAITVPALWLAGLARPHIAGMAGVAIAGAYLVRPSRKELRQLAPVVKVVSLVAVAVAAYFLATRAEEYLAASRIDTRSGLAAALQETTRRTAQGGSGFTPTPVNSPLMAPVVLATVLFRPLAVEAHNLQQLVAAAEGTFLLLLTFVRFRSVTAAIRNLRRTPYVAYCVIFVGLFVLAFSGIANFGIITRQRVQILPLFLALLAFPGSKAARPAEPAEDSRDRVLAGS